MTHLEHGDPGAHAQMFAALREAFGFLPAIFRAQIELPRVIEAETSFIGRVVQAEGALSRLQKECIIFVVAAARRNRYWLAAQYQILQLLGVPERQLEAIAVDHREAGLTPGTVALLGFALKVCGDGASVRSSDVRRMIDSGITEQSVFEAVAAAGLARFLCMLSTGLCTPPDFMGPSLAEFRFESVNDEDLDEGGDLPRNAYLRVPDASDDNPMFAVVRQRFGLVLNLFRAQMLRPDILATEVDLAEAILTAGSLTPIQKEQILLAVAADDRNTCGVALHSAILERFGVTAEQTSLPPDDLALLDIVSQLTGDYDAFGAHDRDVLRSRGFGERQILELVLTSALGGLLDTLQFGVGAAPDFEPRRAFRPVLSKKVHPAGIDPRPIAVQQESDPDADEVKRVRSGDLDAFETLIDRHGRRVYRTLIGLLGSQDEARDAMQDTFMKAFQNIGAFQQRSKFSTWLISIATNTGLQRLRERRPVESIGPEGEEGFRPRQIRSWTDDPEKLYSQAEMRALVEKGVMSLPSKYRVVLMLRDIEQLPIEDTAAALGLGIPAAKSRLLRGRLMLREALSPYFVPPEGKAGARSVPL
jgi:RNA polymerase sigma-70 factor, ECF subfamily